MTRPRLRRRIFLLFALVLALVVLLARFVLTALDMAGERAELMQRTHEVRESLAQVDDHLHAAVAAQRGYLLTGRALFLSSYQQSRVRLNDAIARLARRVVDNRDQAARVTRLRELIALRVSHLDDAIDRHDDLDHVAISDLIAQDERLQAQREIELLTAEVAEHENALLSAREDAAEAGARQSRFTAVAAVVLSMTALLLALLVIAREHERRSRAELALHDGHQRLEESLAESRQLAADLNELTEFGERLQGCQTLDEVLQATGDLASVLLPQVALSVLLINSSRNLVELAYSTGAAPAGEAVFPPEACWALRRGREHDSRGSLRSPRCNHLGAANQATGAGMERCLPLSAQGESLGILHLSTDQDLGEREHRLGLALARQLSLAIANQSLQASLRTQSIRDPLTGLFNRRYLEVSFAREIERSLRRGLPLALLMLDIDHFKSFNDSHGHEAGDRLLQGFGELLQQVSRKEDIACRYGGEEFALILPESDAEAAQRWALAMRERLRDLHLSHRGQPLPAVTVSIGIACLPDHGSRPEDLFAHADAALYRAKREGRDRSVLASLQRG